MTFQWLTLSYHSAAISVDALYPSFLSTSCCDNPFFPQWQMHVIGAMKWIRESLLTQHHPFLLVWVFLWNCHWLLAAVYKVILRGIAMHIPMPDFSLILIKFRPSLKPDCDPTQSRVLMSGVFSFFFFWWRWGRGWVYKSQWQADGYLAEAPKQLVGLLLLLARLVERPTWHAVATCLGPSHKSGVIKWCYAA